MSILKPAASNKEFPTFVLVDAVVYRKGTDGELVIANVCNVNLEGPLVVRGKLEVEEEELLPHCVPTHPKLWPTVATNVRSD